jgi:hypothetical protein
MPERRLSPPARPPGKPMEHWRYLGANSPTIRPGVRFAAPECESNWPVWSQGQGATIRRTHPREPGSDASSSPRGTSASTPLPALPSISPNKRRFIRGCPASAPRTLARSHSAHLCPEHRVLLLSALRQHPRAHGLERKFFLRDTGRKLRHLDQEIHTGQSELSAEILAQFGDEEEQ